MTGFSLGISEAGRQSRLVSERVLEMTTEREPASRATSDYLASSHLPHLSPRREAALRDAQSLFPTHALSRNTCGGTL